MAGGFKFAIDFDSRSFKRGADESAEALEDLGKALEDVERSDISRAERDVEGLAKETDQAARSADDLAKEFDDAFRSTEKGAKAAGSTVGKELDDGFDRAGDGVDEFRDESNSTAREAAASFDGSAESIADAFQEVAANAFAGFGPAGAAAGLAIAAGLGVAIQKVQELAEENTEAKETAADLAAELVDGMADASARFREWALEVNEDNPWTIWKDEATTNIEEVADALTRTGEVGAKSIGAIASGNLPEMRDALSEVGTELETMRDKADATFVEFQSKMAETSDATSILGSNLVKARQETEGLTDAQRQRIEDLERVQGLLTEQIEAQEDARKIAVLLIQAEEDMSAAEAELEQSMRETNAQYRERSDLTQSRIESELDLLDGLAALKKREDDATTSLSKGTQAGRDNQRELLALTDAVQAQADAVFEQTGEQDKANRKLRQGRNDLIDAAKAAGFNEREVEKLIDRVLKIPRRRKTDVDVSDNGTTEHTRQEIAGIRGKNVTVGVYADTSAARNALQALSYERPVVDIDVRYRRSGGFYK